MKMEFDFGPAKRLLTEKKADLQLPNGVAVEAYLQQLDDAVAQFKKLNEITHEDVRAAAQIAVDMSKTLIQIALAGLAAFVAFAQATGYLAFTSIRLALMALTAVCFVFSMIAGAFVVSGIWKRGEGRAPSKTNPPWSTESAKLPINAQAGLGIGALLLFGILVLSRPQAETVKGYELGFPGGDRLISSGEISINGQWENLYIVNKRTKDEYQLPPTKSGQADSITLSPK
jgi:hypothetical protein